MAFSPFLRGARAGKKIRTFTEPAASWHIYNSWPAGGVITAGTGNLFSSVTRAMNWGAVGDVGNLLYFAVENGAGQATYPFAVTPTAITAVQATLLPNNTNRPTNLAYKIELLNAANDAVATMTLTAGDLSGATGVGTLSLDGDGDPVTEEDIPLVASNSTLALSYLLVFDPVTHTVSCGVGGHSIASPAAILARTFNIAASGTMHVPYTGTVTQVRFSQAANLGSGLTYGCTRLSIVQNPWVELGDSIADNRALWIARTATASANQYIDAPSLYCGFSGRTLQSTANTNMLAQWEAQTLDWGFKRVVYSGGTNDLATTGAAQQAAVIAADNAILAGLAAGGANVIVTTIPPRGLAADATQNRDAATIAAVTAINANRYQLAQRYGFAFVDLHQAWRVGPGSDLYRAGVSTDGIHPVDGAAGQNINALAVIQAMRAG